MLRDTCQKFVGSGDPLQTVTCPRWHNVQDEGADVRQLRTATDKIRYRLGIIIFLDFSVLITFDK